jgi:peptidoglycan/LPS O-acetylase OafA/YrhL
MINLASSALSGQKPVIPATIQDRRAIPAAKRPAVQKITAFEGLRGILSLTVCLSHIGLNTVAEKLGLHVRFELAVDIFFALSGFVLAKNYYFGQRTFAKLLAGRIARLYPLHMLTLLWCAALAHKSGLDGTLLLQNMLLLQNIGLPPNIWSFNFPSWSISVEIVASLCFFVVLRRSSAALVLWLTAAGIMICALDAAGAVSPSQNHLGIVNSGLARGAAGFCIGAAAFLIVERLPERLYGGLGRMSWLPPLCLAPFFLLGSWTPLTAALFAGVTLLVLVATASNQGTGPLSLPPLVFLGAISYSVYLLHIPILLTAIELFGDAGARGLLAKCLMVMAVLAASAICYHAYEMPMQRLLLSMLTGRGKSQPI